MKNLLIVVLAFFSLSAAAAVIGPDQVQGQQQGGKGGVGLGGVGQAD